MGIKGLLQFLSSAQRDVNISSFRGQTVAVDAYCWLHKGAYSCAMQLVMKSEKCENLPFVRYCMKRIHLLRQNGITPIVVFDGANLPMKSNTEKERRERRQSYLQKGKALLKDGRQSEAMDCFQKCVDVSPEMALTFIKELRKHSIQVIVAPYEADAQLAYLAKEGIAHLVITEDSDLLAFGCPKVFFKMSDAGDGKLIEFENIGKSQKSLIGFTPDSFRHVCILSGCDYLQSIPGVGLATAVKLMRKYNKNPYSVIKGLNRGGNGKVPPRYEESFHKADDTFLYQIVFDPRTQGQVRLTTPSSDSELTSVGIYNSPSKQVGLARGNINPLTLAVMDTFSPAKAGSSLASVTGVTTIKPGKSSSWSVVNSSGSHYPIKKQSTITVSQRAKKEYKRPARTREENDEETAEEDLKAMYGADAGNTSQTGLTSAIRWEEVTDVHKISQTRGISLFAKGTCRSKYFKNGGEAVEVNSTSSLDLLDEHEGLKNQLSWEDGRKEDSAHGKASSLDSGIGSVPPDSSPMSDDSASSIPGCISKKRLNFDSLEREDAKRMKLNIAEEVECETDDVVITSEEKLICSYQKNIPGSQLAAVHRKPSLRLGLSRRTSTTSSSSGGSNIMSYFSYKGKEKLKP